MAIPNDFEYIEASEFIDLPVIVIKDVKSFIRFANGNEVKYIFKIAGEQGTTDFFFPLGNMIYRIEAKGFRTLADMQLALNRGFPSAPEYYESEKAGFTTYQEYIDLGQTGIENKEEYEAAYKSGFVASFDKFKSKYEEYKSSPYQSSIPGNIDNPVKLHQYAVSKGINNYEQFDKVYSAGFADDLAYNDAQSKGFQDAAGYYDAIKRGFAESREYKEARQLRIENKKEYEDYRHLKNMNEHRDYSFDQLQLLIALSGCENGRILSLAEVKQLLADAQQKLKRPAGAEGHTILPVWYSRRLDKEENVLKFLKENEELKKFGFFNVPKNAFEIFKASSIKILVDGSNVAHNNKDGKTAKPEMRYVRLMVKELNSWKFKNVIVIADASIRHKVKDYNLVNELRKECEYVEAPAKTSADEFLIESAKKEKCLIVTNDQFNEWRKKDKWIRDKFDSMRVPFIITKEDHVILKGMNEIREKYVDSIE